MQENNNADSNSDKREKNDNPAQRKVVRGIVAGGIIAILVILFVSLFFPNLTERTKFFTTNVLSVLLLDVIIVQAYIYRKQWEAMREQLNIARSNMIYAQRAWLVIQGGTIALSTGEVVFSLIIENAGNSPANAVEIHWTVELRDRPPTPKNGDLFPHKDRIGVLGPKTTIHRDFATEANAATVFEAIERGQQILQPYCWGNVYYHDIFNRLRRTKFCWGRNDTASWGRISPQCDNWNEAK